MKDILFDAEKIVVEIIPLSWGQSFSDGKNGRGISLARVLECLELAKVENADDNNYVKESPSFILEALMKLASKNQPLFKSEEEIREALSYTYRESTRNFSGGEKNLFNALNELHASHRFSFYLLFHDELDRLIQLAQRKPKKAIIEEE